MAVLDRVLCSGPNLSAWSHAGRRPGYRLFGVAGAINCPVVLVLATRSRPCCFHPQRSVFLFTLATILAARAKRRFRPGARPAARTLDLIRVHRRLPYTFASQAMCWRAHDLVILGTACLRIVAACLRRAAFPWRQPIHSSMIPSWLPNWLSHLVDFGVRAQRSSGQLR